MRPQNAIVLIALATVLVGARGAVAAPLRVGFAEADITPDPLGKKPVWLAGYGFSRRARGVHDPIMARCIALGHDDVTTAWVSLDLVGFQYPHVLKIREQLAEIDYVMVASTHNHEGPDVIGIWGPTPIHRGVDDRYIDLVIERVVQIVRQATAQMTPASAFYGAAADESLLSDSRLPDVKDGVLRALRFEDEQGENSGVLVQWNCHPESLGAHNQQLTADFPYATVAALKERFQCPVVYFSGAVGGLMAPPGGLFHDAGGRMLNEGEFQFAEAYGQAVANLAAAALDDAAPIELTPLAFHSRQIALPVENPWYRVARAIGVLQRSGRVWTGDHNVLGDLVTGENADQPTAVVTEVAYLQLGELKIACIPGEIYPELVYGKIQDPIEAGADFPDAPREPSVVELLDSERWLLFGLANDEVGYLIPKRQWDAVPPYAYGRNRSQYGEINSCGANSAPVVMQALAERVAEGNRVKSASAGAGR